MFGVRLLLQYVIYELVLASTFARIFVYERLVRRYADFVL